MTDYGTIKIPRDEYELHNERREELGLTWAEYIDAQAPDTHDLDEAALADRLADDLAGRLPERIAAELEGRGY